MTTRRSSRRLRRRWPPRVSADPAAIDAHLDWGDRAPAVRIEVDQDKARAIGLSSAQVARALGGAVSGAVIGQFREDDQLIGVVLRAPPGERASLANLRNLQIRTATGRSVPLAQIAAVDEIMEEADRLAAQPRSDDHGAQPTSSTACRRPT